MSGMVLGDSTLESVTPSVNAHLDLLLFHKNQVSKKWKDALV
jgi:hypothetical protein